MKKISFYLKLTLIITIIFSALIVINFIHIKSTKMQDKIITIQDNNIKEHINGFFKHKKDEYTFFTYTFFHHPYIVNSLKNRNNNQFYDDIISLYKNYKKLDKTLSGIHIVLADGTSFMRIDYQHTDDQLPLIQEALNSKKMRTGIEIDTHGNLLRILYPIFNEDNDFIAIAEMTFKINEIMEDIKENFDYNLAILIKKDTSQNDAKRTLDDYSIQYSTSVEITKYLYASTTKSQKIYLNNKEYQLSTFKLNEMLNESKFVITHDISTLVSQRTATFYSLVTIVSTISLFGILFIIFVINFFIKKVEEKEKESLSKTKMLYFNSRHNNITKLANINILTEEIKKLQKYSIIMLKIDNTSIFSTTYGPETVDQLIKKSALALERTIPLNSNLYHINFDEFIILLDQPTLNQEILLSSQIKSYFEHSPVEVNEIRSIIHFSFGIATHSEDNPLDIYSKANIALVEAKHRGKGLILMYNKSMSDFGSYTQLAKNIAILQKDLEDENLIPFYQPIVNTFTKKIIKYEVLARVKDANTFLSPFQFMKAAEISGLQTAITKQIIQKSFAYFASTDTAFSINITKQDLLEKYLIHFLDIKTKKYNIDPSNVTIEILEDIVIDKNDNIIEQINNFHELGFVIAIDDFGVESSNMSRISDLKIDFIKIDGSFIKDLDTNPKHFKIVESLVFMGKKLNVKIIAEFVHNETIYNIVKSLGIEYSQGYYFSEPKEYI